MSKKKIIAVAGALIAICLIVAVSIPALDSRNRQNVTEPPVNDTREPAGAVKGESSGQEPPVNTVNDKQENTDPAHDKGATVPASNTAPNDGSNNGADI